MTGIPNDDGDDRGGLRTRLPRVSPPAGLERRVLDTLASRGLIRSRPGWNVRWAAGAGLVAAGFILGILTTGTRRGTGPFEPTGRMAQYALLLYGDTPGDTGTVHAARASEYGRWASALSAGARWVGGHELGRVIETVGPSAGRAAAGDRMAGYFIIEAASPERAAEVARSSPHVRYGGRVVVMSIAP